MVYWWGGTLSSSHFQYRVSNTSTFEGHTKGGGVKARTKFFVHVIDIAHEAHFKSRSYIHKYVYTLFFDTTRHGRAAEC